MVDVHLTKKGAGAGATYPYKERVKLVLVPSLPEALRLVMSVPDAVRVILDSGVTRAALARSLGVTSMSTWRWQVGRCLPGEPMVLLCLLEWSKQLSENNNQEGEENESR